MKINHQTYAVPKLKGNVLLETHAYEWEQRKLSDLVSIVGGGTPSSTIESYWNGKINWFSPSEIGNDKYVSKSKKTITNLGLDKSSAKLLPKGTVLFTSRASIGEVAILKETASTNQGFQSLIPIMNKTTPLFIFSMKEQLKIYGLSVSNGSTFKEVSNKSMKQMPIIVPNVDEQKVIGIFFDYIDQIIDFNECNKKSDIYKEMSDTIAHIRLN